MIDVATKPGVGSIVIRWGEGPVPALLIGQIIEPAEHKGRWTVAICGKLETWHRLTILRTLDGWSEAGQLATAGMAILKTREVMIRLGISEPLANAITNEAMNKLASGEWA